MPSLSNVLKRLPIRDLFDERVIGDSKRAAKIYSKETQPTYPGLNHQFFANFMVNNGFSGYFPDRVLPFYIKSFDRPSVTIDTVELHQYNKKRIVQTGLHYGPVTVTFYDTNDRALQLLFVAYCSWYYGDFSENKTDASWDWDIVAEEFRTDAEGWGFTPSNSEPNQMYFFNYIDLYDTNPDGSYVAWRMMHPLIESWSLGTNDYEGNQQKMISFTFKHEGFDVLSEDGQNAAFSLNELFRMGELSNHAELPSNPRSFLTNAASITRDISSGNFSNIATRLGLPLGGVIESIQTGNINPVAIGSDVIRVAKGSSALNSFGNFVFGDVASSSPGSTGGVLGDISSFLGLSESGNAAGLSPAAGAAAARRGGILSQTSDQASTQTGIVVDDSPSITGTPVLLTPQVATSEEGRVALDLATTISGTEPGRINETGTELPKNFVNRQVAAGKPQLESGIDTNKFQAAQGLVQTGRNLPDDFRDALAGAVVNASNRTGTPVTGLAAPAKRSTSSTPTRPGTERELTLTSQALREVNRLKPASAQYGYKGQGLLNANDPDARRLLAAKR